MTYYVAKPCMSLDYRRNKSNFLNEGEDSHDDGIWTRPGLTTAFSVFWPDFHVSIVRSTDLGIDTLVQYQRQALPHASAI